MDNVDFQYFCELATLFRVAVAPTDVPLRFRSAFQLMHHPRMSMVKHIPYRGFTLGGSVHLDGLTAQLEGLFYPSSRRMSTGGGKSGGASRGNTVSEEIDKLVNSGIMPQTMHKYTIKTLQYLKDHQLQPFAAELIVFDERIEIATPIDIACVDLACADMGKNIVMIELKTGFDNNYDAAGGFFHSPFAADSALLATTDSHRNKHQLQALVEHLIVAKNYTAAVRETRVLVISEKIHSSYGLCPHIRRLATDVYTNLRKRLQARQVDPDYALRLRHDAERKGQSAARAKKFAK